MPSRYTPKQKKENPYKKWSLIIVPVLLIIAAASWYVFENQNSTSDVEDAAENEVQTSQQPGIEQPEEKKATEETIQESKDTEQAEESKASEKTAEPKQQETREKPKETETTKEREAAKGATSYSDTIGLPAKPTVIKGILLVNKQHPLPETYAPGESREARSAFESMRKEALKQNIDLVAFSTYRDFARQKELYNGYVAKDGQKGADRYSARPGYSEHQTGLAFDIGEAGQEQRWASASFGETKAGKWLVENAHNYGFILRYPKGSESVTGYMHESWHYRYVGKKAATEIYKKGITLEQYLGV